VIIVCPFCKTENKVKKDSEHVICYKCHNSVNIQKDNRGSSLSQYQNKANNNGPPQNKSMRFSDMFFPDPMFNPGYYPTQAGCCHHNHNNNNNVQDEVAKALEKMLLLQRLQNNNNNNNNRNFRPSSIDKYGPLKQLIKDVDEVGVRKVKNSGTPGNFKNVNRVSGMNDDIYNEVYTPNKFKYGQNNLNYEGGNSLNFLNNKYVNPDSNSKGNAIYKTMFQMPNNMGSNEDIMRTPQRKYYNNY
jgi:hypothetical protein